MDVQTAAAYCSNSHQCLPFIKIMVALEDYTLLQQTVCFDFSTALLSLLQDETFVQIDNLVINQAAPLSMFQP